MAKFLQHKVTGKLFPYNPDLAKHESMIDYVPEIEEVAEEPKKPAPRKPAPKKAEPKADPVDLGDL